MAPENTLMLCSWEKQKRWKPARPGGGWVWQVTPVKGPSHRNCSQWGKPNSSFTPQNKKKSENRSKCLQKRIATIAFTHLVKATFCLNCAPLCCSFVLEKEVKSQSTPRSSCWCPISAAARPRPRPCSVGSHCWYQHRTITMNLFSISSMKQKPTLKINSKWSSPDLGSVPWFWPAVCRDNTQRLLPLWTFKKRERQTRGQPLNISSVWCPQQKNEQEWHQTWKEELLTFSRKLLRHSRHRYSDS